MSNTRRNFSGGRRQKIGTTRDGIFWEMGTSSMGITWCDEGGGDLRALHAHPLRRGADRNLYYQKYLFTGDKEWLRERAWPVVKGAAEFYRTFPNVQRGEDGKWHILHINNNESGWTAPIRRWKSRDEVGVYQRRESIEGVGG